MAEKLLYSMGEVAEMFDVRPSLIRHWESQFAVLRPKRNKKGNRLFTPQDVENLKLIYHLVKERGMTLDGARKALRQHRADRGMSRDAELMERLQRIRALLLEVREDLKAGPDEILADTDDADAGERADAPGIGRAAADVGPEKNDGDRTDAAGFAEGGPADKEWNGAVDSAACEDRSGAADFAEGGPVDADRIGAVDSAACEDRSGAADFADESSVDADRNGAVDSAVCEDRSGAADFADRAAREAFVAGMTPVGAANRVTAAESASAVGAAPVPDAEPASRPGFDPATDSQSVSATDSRIASQPDPATEPETRSDSVSCQPEPDPEPESGPVPMSDPASPAESGPDAGAETLVARRAARKPRRKKEDAENKELFAFYEQSLF